MKVRIDRGPGPDGDWHYHCDDLRSARFGSYGAAAAAAKASGHEIDNAGWRHKMLMWNFNMHAIDGYPGWEIEREKTPAFVKLTHTRGKLGCESSDLANAWDDIAEADFYQRDWTSDGNPFVRDGETYWSGWWFATIKERDRFVQWQQSRAEVLR